MAASLSQRESASQKAVRTWNAGKRGSRETGKLYYSQDGLGSVRTLTDGAGVVRNRYDYSAFGEPYAPGTSSTVSQRYTYTGRELNPVSDTHQMRYRVQDPGLGRWFSRDPLGYDGLAPRAGVIGGTPRQSAVPTSWMPSNVLPDGNLTSHVMNRPYRFIDPLGLTLEDCCDECERGTTRRCRVVKVEVQPWGPTPGQIRNAEAAAEATDTVAGVAGAASKAQGAIGTGIAQGVGQAAAEAAAEETVSRTQEAVAGKMPGAKEVVGAGKTVQGRNLGWAVWATIDWDVCKRLKCMGVYKPNPGGKTTALVWTQGGPIKYECRSGLKDDERAHPTKESAEKQTPACIREALRKHCGPGGTKN